MQDTNGRPYAKLSELKAGDRLELDSGFTCRTAGPAIACQDDEGLYFHCKDGRHRIAGQADNGEDCIGIYKSEA